jgi:hypothetical protein
MRHASDKTHFQYKNQKQSLISPAFSIASFGLLVFFAAKQTIDEHFKVFK